MTVKERSRFATILLSMAWVDKSVLKNFSLHIQAILLYNYFKKYCQKIPKPFTFGDIYKRSKIFKKLQFHPFYWSKFQTFSKNQ